MPRDDLIACRRQGQAVEIVGRHDTPIRVDELRIPVPVAADDTRLVGYTPDRVHQRTTLGYRELRRRPLVNVNPVNEARRGADHLEPCQVEGNDGE